MISEQELRDAVRRSRNQGFRALFDAYSGYVYAIIWYRIRGLGTHEDAEEAVSDVFANVFRMFDRIEEGKLQSYIRIVAKHAAIDTCRRLSARPESIPDDPDAFDPAAPETVEQESAFRELWEVLIDEIHALGEPDTTIVMQLCFYGRSAAETAKIVRLSPAAVRMRLTRARKRLRKALSDAGFTL